MPLKIFLAKAEARARLLHSLYGQEKMNTEIISNTLTPLDRAKAILAQEEKIKEEIYTLETMIYRSGINTSGLALLSSSIGSANRQLIDVVCLFKAVVEYLENKPGRNDVWDRYILRREDNEGL